MGPFPPELQHYLVINTGISSHAKHAEAAKVLVKSLMLPSADTVIKATGLERASHQSLASARHIIVAAVLRKNEGYLKAPCVALSA